jgi:hypothetical protein
MTLYHYDIYEFYDQIVNIEIKEEKRELFKEQLEENNVVDIALRT